MQKISADGVRLIKLKTGFKSHQFDIMRCEYIRKYHPELSLALTLIGAEAEEGLAERWISPPLSLISTPVRAHDYETMAKINRQCPVLLLADSVFGPEDVKKAIIRTSLVAFQ